MKTSGVVRCDQLRTIDLTSRGARWLERAPDFVLEEVLNKLLSLFA